MPMNISILAFGIARDIVGQSEFDLLLGDIRTVGELKRELVVRYPDFAKLVSLAIAVNGQYVSDEYLLEARDEVVIIPPVSGG